MTVSFLTSTGATVQAFTVPAGWVRLNNIVEVVGAGGAGSARQSSTRAGTGGGGGAYAKKSALDLDAGDVVYYRLPAGGVNAGTNPVDAWFNDLNLLPQTDNAIGTSPWYLLGGTVTQGQSNSFGSSKATKFTESAANVQHGFGVDGGGFATIIKPASVSITFTATYKVKAVGTRNHKITLYDTAGSGAYIALNVDGSGTIYSGNYGSGWSTPTLVQDVADANGFRLIVIQSTVNNAATLVGFQITPMDASNSDTYLGDGTSGLIVDSTNLTYGTKYKGFTPTTTTMKASVLARSGTNGTTSAAGVHQTGSQGDTVAEGGDGNRPAASVTTGGGGGGAGGPNGAGTNASTSTGGNADGATPAGSAAGNNGVDGNDFDATHGPGSGAGGRSGNGNGFTGGNAGGGGSGCGVQSGAAGGSGGPALIAYQYSRSRPPRRNATVPWRRAA